MPSTPKWVPSAPSLVEAPNSGEIVFDEQATLTKIYNGKYADCIAAALPKGAVGSGATFGFVVKSSHVSKSRGEIGTLTIIWGGYSGGGGESLPADQAALQAIEMNPNMESAPMFATAMSDATYGAIDDDGIDIKLPDLIRLAGLTVDGRKSAKSWKTILALYTDELPTPSAELEQAVALADLLRRGIQNYQNFQFRYVWITFHTSAPSVSRGGFQESPGGPFASIISGLGLDCLREADDLDFQDGFYRLTNKWKCAVTGNWDDLVYPPGP